MPKLFAWLSRRRWFISLPVVLVAGIVAYLLIAGVLDWANSVPFCGTICHSMTPEYTAYQQSFHARVRCVECHVGPGLGAEIRAKWEGIRELYLYVTNTYERPIPSPVESLRPARETCEQCHWPEVFYNDRAVDIVHYAEDQANTRSDTYMLVKIGGGTQRSGQGRGIHWHIQNVVEYIATDPQRQKIPWVRAQLDGESVTYVDATQPLSEADLQKYVPRVMDCIDCHNRATHIFRSSTTAVEESMANGLLPTDLPYLRQKAVEVVGAEYSSEGEAMAAIAGIADYYQANYPDVYSKRSDDIARAVEVLQGLYRASHFPEYKVVPGTYPDNVGHSDSPGCFRCHDGNHLAADGSSIRLHCNICHTIPQTVAAGQPAPAIPFQPAMLQPDSHLASNWMAQHRYIADQSCASCHQMQTFCANPNCHGRSWPYVNLKAVTPPYPLPQPVPATPTPTTTPAALSEAVQRGGAIYANMCASCHPRAPEGEEGALTRDDLARVVLNGDEDMPAFQLSDSQLDDLFAFVTWWVQHPGEPIPQGTPAALPTAVPGATTGPAPSFSQDILPLLQSKCATCHGAGSGTRFKAVDYAGVTAVVVPGDPEASIIVQKQRGQHAVLLSATELDRLIAWIKAGAPNN